MITCDLQHLRYIALSVCRSLVANIIARDSRRVNDKNKIVSYSRDNVSCERRLTCYYATAHYIRAIYFLLIKRNILSLKINPHAAR